MIFSETKLTVCDNSGAKLAQCIKTMGVQRNMAKAGEVIVVTLKKILRKAKKKKLFKGSVVKAVIVQGSAWRWRENAHHLRNFVWTCVLLKKDGYTPRATRIKIPIAFELYETLQIRALLLSNKLI